MVDILNDLNLNKNQIQNVVLQKLASAPSNPKEGQRYYNTTNHKSYEYNGTSWVTYDSLPSQSGNAYKVLGTNGSSLSWENVLTQVDSITIYETDWVGSSGVYIAENISINGNTVITSYSKVDIQPDSTVITQLISDGVKAMYIENDSGTLNVYSIGAYPSVDLTLQVTVQEVLPIV